MLTWKKECHSGGRKQSMDTGTKIKPDTEQSLDGHPGAQPEVSQLDFQPNLVSCTLSDEKIVAFPATILNKEASVSRCKIAQSEDGQTQKPTGLRQECSHTGELSSSAPVVAALESPQCQVNADKTTELCCSAHQLPVCTLCTSFSCWSCQDMQTLDAASQESSGELWDLAKTLKAQEAALARQRKEVEEKLMAMHIKPRSVSVHHELSSERKPDWTEHEQRAQPVTTDVSHNVNACPDSTAVHLPQDLPPEQVVETKTQVYTDEVPTSIASSREDIIDQSSDREQDWDKDQRTVETPTTRRSLEAAASSPADILAQSVKAQEDQAEMERQSSTDMKAEETHAPVERQRSTGMKAQEDHAPVERQSSTDTEAQDDQTHMEKQRSTDSLLQVTTSPSANICSPDDASEISCPNPIEGLPQSSLPLHLPQTTMSTSSQKAPAASTKHLISASSPSLGITLSVSPGPSLSQSPSAPQMLHSDRPPRPRIAITVPRGSFLDGFPTPPQKSASTQTKTDVAAPPKNTYNESSNASQLSWLDKPSKTVVTGIDSPCRMFDQLPDSTSDRMPSVPQTPPSERSLQTIVAGAASPGSSLDQLPPAPQMSPSDIPPQSTVAQTSSPCSSLGKLPPAAQMSHSDIPPQTAVAVTVSTGNSLDQLLSDNRMTPLETPPETMMAGPASPGSSLEQLASAPEMPPLEKPPQSIVPGTASRGSSLDQLPSIPQRSPSERPPQNTVPGTASSGSSLDQLPSLHQTSSFDRPPQTTEAATASLKSTLDQLPSTQISSSERLPQTAVAGTTSRGSSLDQLPSAAQTSALESPVGTTGQAQEPESKVPGDKPHGPALAKILQVGHRVKRALDEGGYGLGTVTAIPSARIATRGKDPSGVVDVRWDAGGQGCYRMGRYNHYELELA